MAKIHNPQDQDGKSLINETTFETQKTHIETILGVKESGEKSLFEMINDNANNTEANSNEINKIYTTIGDVPKDSTITGLIAGNGEEIVGIKTTIGDIPGGATLAGLIGNINVEISSIKEVIGDVAQDATISDLINNNTSLINTNKDLINANSDLINANSGKISEINSSINELQNKNTELENKDAELENLINTKANLDTIDTINAAINSLNDKDTELEALINTNKTSLESINTAIDSLNDKDTELESSVNTVNKSIESINTTIDSLNGKDGELQTLINTNKASLESINTVINGLKGKDTELENSINTNATAIADLQTKDTELEGLIGANTTAITGLQAEDIALQTLITANATANTALTEKLDAFIKTAPVHSQSIQSDSGVSIRVRGIGEEIKEGGRLKSLTIYCPSANNTTETIWLKVFKMHESGSGEHTFIGISDEALQHGQNNVLNYTFNNSDIILEKGTTYFFTFATEAQKDSTQFQSSTADSTDCCIKVITRTNETAGILGSNTWSDRSKMPLYNIEFYSSLAKVGADAKTAVEDLDVRVDSLESLFDAEFNFTKTFGNWHLLGSSRTNVANAHRVKLVPTESGFIKSFTIKCRPEGNGIEPTTVATYLTVEDENGNEIARSLKALNHGLENSSGKILKFEFESKSIIDEGATYYFVFRREDNDQEINACFVTTLTASGGATDEELFGGTLQGNATVTAQMVFEMELLTETLRDKTLTHINDTTVHIEANEREQWNAKASIIDVEEKISTAINEVKSDIQTIETSVNDIIANIAALKPYKFNVADGLPVVKADFSDTIIEDVFTLDDNGVATYIIPADIYKVDIISSEKTETFVIGEDKPADHVLYTVNNNTLTAANGENALSIKAYKAAADIQNIEVELILNDSAGKVITANAVSLAENVMCSADIVSHGVKISAYINKPESNIDSHIVLDSICDSNTYDNSQHVCQVLRLEITI